MAAKGPCAGAAAHRKRQAKYVAKNRAAHNARVKAHYQKNKTKILRTKKAQRTKGITRRRTGGPKGRPRKC